MKINGELGFHKTERDRDISGLLGDANDSFLSIRMAGRLLDMGIKSLNQAAEFSRKSFLQCKGVGLHSVNELEKHLNANGLSFAPHYRQPWKDDGNGVLEPLKLLGTVYFIRAADKIKIGYSSKGGEYRRLKSLQTSNYQKLELIAIITDSPMRLEKSLHKKFSHLHIRGEWFEFSDELKAFIKEKASIV